MLIDRGFKRVRPLSGGLEAWEEAGYEVESEPLIAIQPTGSFPKPATGETLRPKG
jgi:3-mercaptopyruvate sulfurtransferase SseA